jgi:hypothetical protein
MSEDGNREYVSESGHAETRMGGEHIGHRGLHFRSSGKMLGRMDGRRQKAQGSVLAG